MIRGLAPLPLLMLAAAAASAADLPSVSLDNHVVHQWSLTTYLPATVYNGTVAETDPLTGSIAHHINGTWQPGAAARLGWQRIAFDTYGDGWFIGFGLAAEYARGQVDTDTIGGVSTPATENRLWMQSLLGQCTFGYCRRWDDEAIRLAPHDWQLDMGPVVSAGAAQVRVADGEWSETGPALGVGVRIRLSAAIGNHWRLGGEVGADATQAHVSWLNTGHSTFNALGPVAGISLIYEH